MLDFCVLLCRTKAVLRARKCVSAAHVSHGNSQIITWKINLCVWLVLASTLQGSTVIVLVSGVTGSSEYFCQRAKIAFSEGTIVFTAEAQRTDEGCSCPSLHASVCHRAAVFQVELGRVRREAEGKHWCYWALWGGTGEAEFVALQTQWDRFSL